MEYLIVAHDGTDAEAPRRRLAARPAHLETAKSLKEKGRFINGGALLDDDGNMIGSALLMDFPSREELDDWLRSDPYAVGDVWRTIEVTPVRLALRDS